MSSTENTPEANKAAAPKLCKMGCGFFGSSATGDCCSKCYLLSMSKQQQQQQPKKPLKSILKKTSEYDTTTSTEDVDYHDIVVPLKQPLAPSRKSTITCDETQEAVPEKPTEPTKVAEAPAATATTTKKKKKKASYKSLMADITKPKGNKSVEDERNKLRQHLGGGSFTKVEKI